MLSVKEARKILGRKYSHLKDSEIESIVVLIYNLSKENILEVIKSKYA